MTSTLEIRRFTADQQDALLEFLQALERAGDERWFHPHPFTRQALEGLLTTAKEDVYLVLVEAHRVLGYGMLRGWDAGYEVPSLGIAIHPEARGCGAGRAMMELLHACAARRGARRVRLRFHPQNLRARRLYERLGYRCDSFEGELVVGSIDLGPER